MSSINRELEAALASSAANLTPEQVAQLRTTLAQDTQLLDRLNDDAASGHLRGFALAAPGARNLLGAYDRASGTVTLPADSFGTGGANLSATLRVQHMSLEFAHANPTVTQEMVGNLQDTLNGSPVLAEQVRRAATPPGPGQSAPLEHFALETRPHVGGTYNGGTHTLSLPPASLAPQGHGAKFSPRELTFVLGHEVQHSFNHANRMAAYSTFAQQAADIAKGNTLPHDYTGPIRQALDADRADEASAQIAGWNALLSRERQANPNVGVEEMLRLSEPRSLSDFPVFPAIDPTRPETIAASQPSLKP
jgi:hypothetical protein